MQQAAANLEFEQAAQFRDWHDEMEHMMDRQEAIAAPVLEHNAVAVLPAPHAAADAAAVQLFFIRFGRPVETQLLTWPLRPDDRAHLRARLAHHFDATQERPDRYSKREVDEIRLLSHWLYVHRGDVTQVRWSVAMPIGALLDDVKRAARGCARRAAPEG
jgi:excinuclease UvrABC nuclease subunit